MEQRRREAFNEIYRSRAWVVGDGSVSLSGAGSDVRQTIRLLPILTDFLLRRPEITHIHDIGCGEYSSWMASVLAAFPGLGYTGYDISDHIIAQNRAKYPERTFQQFDVVADPIPRHTAGDLIFCKEVLLHLNDVDVMRALNNLGGGDGLLFLTFHSEHPNTSLDNHKDGRYLNLLAPPFSLPPPSVLRTAWLTGVEIGVWRNTDLIPLLASLSLPPPPPPDPASEHAADTLLQ